MSHPRWAVSALLIAGLAGACSSASPQAAPGDSTLVPVESTAESTMSGTLTDADPVASALISSGTRKVTPIALDEVEATDPYRAPTGRPARATATASPISDALEIEVMVAALELWTRDWRPESLALMRETQGGPTADPVIALFFDHLGKDSGGLDAVTLQSYSARKGRRLDLGPMASHLPEHMELVDQAYVDGLGLRIRELGRWLTPPPPGWPISLSRPGISPDGLQALIHLNSSVAGEFLLLSKTSGEWRLVDRVVSWIS